MNSYIRTLLDQISKLDKKDATWLIGHISDLHILYQNIGHNISNQSILKSIQDTDKDLYDLANFFEQNKLRDQLGSLANKLNTDFDVKSATIISSYNNDLLKSKLPSNENITEIKTDKIWAYIKSGDQIFSRDIDKDINKLIRS